MISCHALNDDRYFTFFELFASFKRSHKFNYFINERRLKKIKTIKMGKDGWILAIKSIKKTFEQCSFRLFNKAIKTLKTA